MDYQSSTFKPRKGQHVQRAGKKDEASRHQSPASQPLSPIDTRRVNQDLESTGANSRSPRPSDGKLNSSGVVS